MSGIHPCLYSPYHEDNDPKRVDGAISSNGESVVRAGDRVKFSTDDDVGSGTVDKITEDRLYLQIWRDGGLGRKMLCGDLDRFSRPLRKFSEGPPAWPV